VSWTKKTSGHNTRTGQISEIARCQERFTNTRRLQMQLARRTNVRIGPGTIRPRLLEDNLYIRRPATGPLLTAAHRQARLQFAENHARWNDK
jgi:hypothetical protein